MALTNQQDRSAVFDLPAKIRQWADHYRTFLTGEPEWGRRLALDFEAEIDDLATPVLRRAFEEGLITVEEMTAIGGEVWEIWADFTNEAQQEKKEGLWTRIKRRLIRTA